MGARITSSRIGCLGMRTSRRKPPEHYLDNVSDGTGFQDEEEYVDDFPTGGAFDLNFS